MPTLLKAGEQPTFEVCGATNDPVKYFAAVEQALPAKPVQNVSARVRCVDRYFGIPQADAQDRSIDVIAVNHCFEQSPDCAGCPLRFHCAFAREELKDSDSTAPTLGDLFCGAGGLSLGFEAVGFSPVLALDNDYWSLFTYRYNRPWLDRTTEIVWGDIAEWLDDYTKPAHMDVVAGGVPCQPFSNANQQRQQADPRHNSFWSEKLKANLKRDRSVDDRLRLDRWKVLRIWEHDIKADPKHAILPVLEALHLRRSELVRDG